MLKVRVIPCLDVMDGRVVKGVRFVSLRDAGDPVEQAKIYNDAGADELMFLDITASHEGRAALLEGRSHARPKPASCRFRSAEGFAASKTLAGCFAPAPTNAGHRRRRAETNAGPRALAEAFGAQAVVVRLALTHVGTPTDGRSSPTAGGAQQALTPSAMLSRLLEWGPESCL